MANIKDSDFQSKHRTEWQDFLWQRFLARFSRIKSSKEARRALDALFSDYEKNVITKRLAALALLREGRSSKEINELLWLSWSTISALKKSLFGNQRVYKSQRSFKKTKKENDFSIKPQKHSWLEDLFGDIDLWELIKNPPRPPGTGIKDSHL